jgi:hypothetical protein
VGVVLLPFGTNGDASELFFEVFGCTLHAVDFAHAAVAAELVARQSGQ